MIQTPLSVLDLALVGRGESVRDALGATVDMARRAEELGYRRIWYAEHHNMSTIASSATSVLIAHVAAHTSTIRLGSGGIMLPNHSPLTIAEQFGTLAELHPGRIDLGLGRAPGTDQVTVRALRRDLRASDRFPQDVVELQGFLGDETRVPGVEATPGKGTHIPIYILGSSLFGAQLAAVLGLPFAFASHFSPDSLLEAEAIYRKEFRPSAQASEPWFIAGVNVITADTQDEAMEELVITRRQRVRLLFGRRDQRISDEEADRIAESPQGRHVDRMMQHTAVGTPDVVAEQLQSFVDLSGADELMIVHQHSTAAGRIRSLELVADAAALPLAS